MIVDIVKSVLDRWNEACKETGIGGVYEIHTRTGKKEFFVSKNKPYEQNVAEFKLIHTKEDKSLCLWYKVVHLPPKVKNVSSEKVAQEFINNLYKAFLYECIGTFCVTTNQLITSQDYAEYDIKKGRLKPHASGDGMVIEITKADDIFEVGDTFDVFIVLDEHYAVYTDHDIARHNNGIYKLPKSYCKIITNAIPTFIKPESKIISLR